MGRETAPLSSSELNELLIYNPETGKLIWKHRTVKWFTDDAKWTAEQCCKRWNTCYANKEAFTASNKGQSLVGSIAGKMYSAHRIIWCMQTGEWPDQIDHENHNPLDNRWINLRNTTQQENMKNLSLRIDNKSGYSGVSKVNNKWRSLIFVDNKRIHLGYFFSKECAIAARKIAEMKYNFHPNHGKDLTAA